MNRWPVVFLSLQMPLWGASMASVAPFPAGERFLETVAPRVYPNPWRLDRDPDKLITFDRLPPNACLKIFTVSGRLVKTIDAPNGSATWDRTNDTGERAASGIYLYLVQDILGQEFSGKLAVIQ